MKKEIEQIKAILNHLEKEYLDENEISVSDSFNYFELPEIVSSIVDYLQPSLSPYEVSIFWFLFRHSIIEKGDVHVRVSNTIIGKSLGSKLQNVSDKRNLCDTTVKVNLMSLEKKGVIKKIGDTNRDGTLYRIFLPEEIEICQQKMKEEQKNCFQDVDVKKEADFYNVRENRYKVFERDGYKCYKCNKQLTRFNATLDHLIPITKGGDNSFDNLRTACLHCNSSRGNKPLSDFLDS